MKVIAILDLASEDDGMVWVKTGLVANHKPQTAIINSKLCAGIEADQIKALLNHWHLFSDSPEYSFVQLLKRMVKEEVQDEPK